MAVRLFFCSVCGHKLRFGASRCPVCGRVTPFGNHIWPYTAGVVILAVLFVLAQR